MRIAAADDQPEPMKFRVAGTPRAPIVLPWTISSVANGADTLTASVRDASGKTGTTSLNATVRT